MAILSHLTWTDCKQYFATNDTVIMPVGSTEQHGPHNPLITDFLTADEIARAVGDNTDTLVLPGLPIGISVHHRQFPGTLWVSEPTFYAYLDDVIKSAAYHGARKFVIVNGHGGNSGALFRLAHTLRMKDDLFMAVAAVSTVPADWDRVTGNSGAGAHGGLMETSFNLYFRPELVRMERIEDENWQQDKLGDLDLQGFQRLPFAVYGQDTCDLTASGIMGAESGVYTSAAGASPDIAREFLERYIEGLSGFVSELKQAGLAGLLCKPDK